MENAEVEVALEELESRLERLRALYEQYFMGIERIEPAIPRKDVDRRIYVLRREKIRNTAKRFKLQTIISRYNTFQQYWQRICREIEAGTYKRHVIRAERIAPGKILTIAARKRLGRAALEAALPDSAPPPASARPPPSILPEALQAAANSAVHLPSPVPRPGIPGIPGIAASPPPKPGGRGPKPISAAERGAPAVEPPRARLETLDLDLDFLGDWDPGAFAGKPKRVPGIPARDFGRPLTQPLVAGRPPKPIAPPATPPRLASAADRPLLPPAQPLAAPDRPAPPRPPIARAALPAEQPAAPLSAAAKPAAAAAAKPAAAAPPKPATAKVVPPKPFEAAPTPALPRPAAVQQASAGAPAVSDRVRELHARLVEAKRQTQDPAAVSMEGLARSMKATEAKLREQHKNRKIDFDVVIKDGKAVLKPIVR